MIEHACDEPFDNIRVPAAELEWNFARACRTSSRNCSNSVFVQPTDADDDQFLGKIAAVIQFLGTGRRKFSGHKVARGAEDDDHLPVCCTSGFELTEAATRSVDDSSSVWIVAKAVDIGVSSRIGYFFMWNCLRRRRPIRLLSRIIPPMPYRMRQFRLRRSRDLSFWRDSL